MTKKKTNMPATPEPPQRMYPVPESAKVIGRVKHKKEDVKEKKNKPVKKE